MEPSINYKKKFKLFLITFLSTITLIFTGNIYFNVYSLFSDYQFEYKVVHSDRLSKFNWVMEMEKQPECFIMGSSNSMRFSPDSIKSITQLETFNFGLFHAGAEEFWCMSNALIDHMKATPKLIIFCLDDWNFSAVPQKNDEIFRGAEKRTAFKEKFAHYLDDYSTYKLRWAQFKAALTFEHTEHSTIAFWKMISTDSAYTRTIPVMTGPFYEDGTRKKYGKIDGSEGDLTDTCESGKFNMSAYLKSVDSVYRKYPTTKDGLLTTSHENFKWFSDRRLMLFARTIEKLDQVGCKVVFNIMPIQPFFKKIVVNETNYNRRIEFFRDYLEALKRQYSNVLLIRDNSDIQNFGGFENHFFDDMHPTSVNSSLMIETFREELSQYAF